MVHATAVFNNRCVVLQLKPTPSLMPYYQQLMSHLLLLRIKSMTETNNDSLWSVKRNSCSNKSVKAHSDKLT